MFLFSRASRARAASRSTSLRNASTSAKPNRAPRAVLETLEGRMLLTASVTSLTLINADTDRDLMTLTNGAVLDFAALPTRNLSIRANVADAVESVRYALDSNLYFRTDNTAPYSLAGDNGLGNYSGWTPSLGSHTLRATPYSLDNAGGTAGIALSINFTVVDSSVPTPPPQPSTTVASVTSLTLINADTDRDLMTLTNGAVLDLSALPTRNLSVRANVAGTVESVRYALDSNLYFRTDNTAPYSLAGDNGLGNYSGWTPSLGSHTLRATPYSLDNAGGTAGTPLTVNFTVVEHRLPAPSQSVVNQAIAYPLIRYNRYILGGAHTNQPAGGGAPLVLALAAQAGNTSADARLLEQIRYTLAGGNEITATGGYPAEHERHITSMFAVVRQVPRIWNQLTGTEKAKIDLLMKAALVASAFTTSDNNPYILSGQHERALDGDTNVGRAWNPNYREGMIGAMLVGMAYFGGPAAATQILETYDHAAFVNQLKSYGLTNIYETFNWYAAHPTGGAPTGAMIQAGIRNYRIWGLPLTNYMGIYWALASNTYGKTVNAGLNGGAGINGAGRIITGADTLPNKGALGMLAEFDSADANGPRSSATYAYAGYRVDQENLLTLIATGYWQPNTSQATAAISRLKIGVPDFWYKVDHGYSNYAKGTYAGTLTSSATDRGFEFTRPLWQNVLKVYFGL